MHIPQLLSRLSSPMLVIGFLAALAGTALAAAPAITTFSPASGTIGASVTITGTGFTGAKTVTFNGIASVFTVTGDTKIVAAAPANLATGKISVTTATGTGASKTNFTVTLGAHLSVSSGVPLTALQVSGAAFPPSTAVDVYFDTTDLALATSTAKGVVSIPIQAPATAQPGTHWVTLVARGTNTAAQAAFVANMNWAMAGASISGRYSNDYENTLNTANAGRLTDVWTKPAGGYANPSPFVESHGSVIVGDVNGAIHAYSSTGTLLWMANPGSSLQSVTPLASNGLVYFGAQNGNVYAYTSACHTNGAICTPLWTKSVGTSVTASLRLYDGMLYVPSSDGTIHVLNPSTGAAGTPIFGIDNTSGAITTPVSFASDGTFYYGAGSKIEYKTLNGGSGAATEGGAVSPIAVINRTAYFTSGDGKINEFGGAGWSAATSGTGCAPAPAVANDVVYAGGCTSLAAFEAGQGTLRWSVTTAGPVIGVSVANGVLYGCIGTGVGFGGSLFAYDATYGSLLWSGGNCIGDAPVVANGTVLAAFASITAYQLPGFQTDAVAARPAPRSLRPDYRLLPNVSRITAGSPPD